MAERYNMSMMTPDKGHSPFDSLTFAREASFQFSHQVGAASISPSGRDIVCAGNDGLHIIDLDNPYDPPSLLKFQTRGIVAEVQWCTHPSRQTSVVSTNGAHAMLWDVDANETPVISRLQAHTKVITDMNCSVFDPDLLATCSADTDILFWDLRIATKPHAKASAWRSGATQIKWNKKSPHVLASSHDRMLYIWDDRKLSRPLRTLEAHSTKIYGIDWSPENESNIITCSLDNTIKFWNINCQAVDDHQHGPLDRVLRTSYPVWRARYTPFGKGILATPAGTDCGMYLYDRRTHRFADRDASPAPVQSFGGHSRPVKEFLWRSRGAILNGYDCRDFQLVSWGSDKKLCLHPMSADGLKKVDWVKGEAFPDSVGRLSHRAAIPFSHNLCRYRTYRREERKPVDDTRFAIPDDVYRDHDIAVRWALDVITTDPRAELLSDQLRDPFDTAMEVEQQAGHGNAIRWMQGVRVSREDDPRQSRRTDAAKKPEFFGADSLGEEISFVVRKYPEITLTKASMSDRMVEVDLQGPWGEGESLVNIQMRVAFSRDYPEASAPFITINRTPEIEPLHQHLLLSLKMIGEKYVKLHKGCFEALILYLLGDHTLDESVLMLPEGREFPIFGLDGTSDLSHSSPSLDYTTWSDEDDDAALGTFSKNGLLEGSITDFTEARNTNVPLPATCGARFAPNGQLACFFLSPKKTKDHLQQDLTVDFARVKQSLQTFKGIVRSRTRSLPDSESSGSTSPISRSLDIPLVPMGTRASEPNTKISYRNGRWPTYYHLRSDWIADPLDTNTELRLTAASEPSAYASLVDLSPILPCNKTLAEEYVVAGTPEEISRRNQAVCEKHGYTDLAKAWGLAALIVGDVVPLERVYHDHEATFTMATRAMVLVTKKDASGNSSQQMKFDEPPAIRYPYKRSMIKWGNHPFGRDLVKKLLSDFEQRRDVQMLAMLSCVFAMQPTEYTQPPPLSFTPGEPDSESEDDDIPPQFRRSKNPPVDPIITFKNQEKFDNSNRAHQALLSADDKARHRAWRLHYGEQLLAWELHQSRAGVLKFNELMPAGMQIEDPEPITGPGAIRCTICLSTLDKMSMACLLCGCEAHQRCISTWKAMNGDRELLEELCPNGCLA
ncbi:MAG: hypothetical protein M1828_006216 [Chrysothrix sp. TS-e1954]|nr:MAG: hypothetical protein M1828_006216 [Chrysothrix sp. TS-e1954]